tara:strand:- start:144 stop:464 length:321 start_codon:yes stop_codon:yes gene_type:complete
MKPKNHFFEYPIVRPIEMNVKHYRPRNLDQNKTLIIGKGSINKNALFLKLRTLLARKTLFLVLFTALLFLSNDVAWLFKKIKIQLTGQTVFFHLFRIILNKDSNFE